MSSLFLVNKSGKNVPTYVSFPSAFHDLCYAFGYRLTQSIVILQPPVQKRKRKKKTDLVSIVCSHFYRRVYRELF